jgi:type I restriction enzyme S subunit
MGRNSAIHYRVADVAAVARNAIVGGPFGSDLLASDYVDDGVPVIRGENLGDGRWVTGPFVSVSLDKAERLAANSARAGDVIFTQRGANHYRQIAIVPEHSFDRYIISQSQMKLTVDRERVLPLYVYYWFRAPEQQDYLKSHAIATGVPHTNLGILKGAPIVVPALDQQRRIVSILGTLDDKIELNRRMNETLEAMARALFKSWFVDFDPVRAKAEGRQPSGMDAETAKLFPSEFEQSELGEIPKGWRFSTLGVEVERCGGGVQTGPFGSQLHASDYVNAGVPVVMPKDISGRRVSTATIARVPESDAARLSRHRLQPGDVVYSRRGDVERHALISDREAGWLCGTGCLLVRLGTTWPSPAFASFALDRAETRAWISQHAIGATMPNLNTGILAAVPLVMPPDAVLQAFAQTVDPWQSLIVVREAEATVLASLRDELLPRLLSGELSPARVHGAAEAVESVR